MAFRSKTMTSPSNTARASRPSYDISLVNENDTRWANDKSQKHCYVCTKVKLVKGKRHHCRLCGNIACKDCCPRICKKCLAENIASTSLQSESTNYEPIQRLCKLKSQQIRWKKVTMVDKTHYEPVYVVHEDSTNIVIIRCVDGDYYAIDKNLLFPAPEKENILDSIQSLLHGFINRSNESSFSFKKPIYALTENENMALYDSMSTKKFSKRNGKKQTYEMESSPFAANGRVLKRCNIFSFFPMLQQESYKLEGFIFKSSLTKMYINNVQLFHYVSDDEQPKKIPAYTPPIASVVGDGGSDEQKISVEDNDMVISANSRRNRKSASLTNIKAQNMAILELELESFKKGYQEMRKMYEAHVKLNETKMDEANQRQIQNEETIDRLEQEVEHLTQMNAKYKQAMELNANKVDELQQQLKQLSVDYQQKLNSQSSKFKNNTEKTTNVAESKLIEMNKNLEEANEKIEELTLEIEGFKTAKSTNTAEEVIQYRLQKEQERAKESETKLKAKDLELQKAKRIIAQLSKPGNGDNEKEKVVETMKDKIARDYDELFNVDHKELFDLLFDLIRTHRVKWNEEYLYPLIYEFLFQVLLKCFNLVHEYEKNVSSTLCKQFSVNKAILYESFYNEWIKNSNYAVFLHSTDKVKEIKDYIIDTMFMKDFISKHLELTANQIAEQIHLKFALFTTKCINMSWKMCTQYPLLRFTPNKFNVEQVNKSKYHKELHNIYHDKHAKDHQFILYYIWPVISHNDFHAIVDDMKIQVALGDTLPDKVNEDDMKDEFTEDSLNGNESNVVRSQTGDESDFIGMMIYDHDDGNLYNHHQIGDDDYY